MNRRRIARTIVTLVAILVIAGSCATGSAAPASRVPAPPPPAAGTPVPAAGDPTPGAPAAAATPGSSPFMLGDIADLLVLRASSPTPNAAFAIVDPVGGRVLFELPDGIVSRDWRRLASLAAVGDATRVEVTTPEGGEPAVRIDVPGAWRLPTVGVAGEASGLSADGSTLVLEEATAAAGAGPSSRTRFAIVPTSGSAAPRIVTLDGAFGFDVLSPDGSWLYLLEYRAGGDPTHYQVRRLDVATGRLEDGVIVDKRNIDEQMNGYALIQEPGTGGWVYTLYQGDEGAFVHALDTADGAAFCIDLPGTEAADASADGGWGLVADASGDRLYVADPVRRTVSAIDLADFSIVGSGRLASVPSVRLAKLERARPVGGRAALSADGRDLFVIDTTGVAVVRVADLATSGHLGGNGVFHSIAVGSDDAVYAVDDSGRVVHLGTGPAVSAPVSDGRYSSIVAVVPMR